ncbi:MAG: peptide chain release factor N(5)-glutamine methyltransferase [Bacteroidales bacterium]|nr:peptide chain release factor N(5)-glutamine methyltransferase [Bacteroidales bacterium]
MLLPQFIREGGAALEALYPPQEARSLILRLCSEVLGTQSYTHIVEPSYEIPEEKLPRLYDAVSRMVQGEPLQYVTGVQEFCGRKFRVAPGVLIPRPETEMLVAGATQHLRLLLNPLGPPVQGEDLPRCPRGPHTSPVESATVLDLFTGSGCIAWSIALDVPGTRVTGVDISGAALAVARSQTFPDAAGAPGAVEFVLQDVLEVPDNFAGAPFDVITANPPYIRESEKAAMHRNVLEYEPSLALFVPDEDPMLFYRAVAHWSIRFLKPGGWGIVEINEELGAETAAVFESAGLVQVKKHLDLFGKERFVSFEKVV